MSLMKHFLASIDNVSGTVERVHQIVVVPVFGHPRHGEGASESTTPIAVIQLINKQNMKPIDQVDLVSAHSHISINSFDSVE